jgi:hypothetical protein
MKRVIAFALAVATAAGLAPVAQARTAGTTRPDGSDHRRSANVTFTKWLTSLPNAPSARGASMAGVAAGAVGPGTFAGFVLTEDTTSRPHFWLAKALYGFSGGKHSFVAYNHIAENDAASPITARIRGVVVAGWMKGARVTGAYTVLDTCPMATPGNVSAPSCFQGTLHLRRGHAD